MAVQVYYAIETAFTCASVFLTLVSRKLIFKSDYELSWFIRFLWWGSLVTSFCCMITIQAYNYGLSNSVGVISVGVILILILDCSLRALLFYQFGLSYFQNSIIIENKLIPKNHNEKIDCSSLCQKKYWKVVIALGCAQLLTFTV